MAAVEHEGLHPPHRCRSESGERREGGQNDRQAGQETKPGGKEDTPDQVQRLYLRGQGRAVHYHPTPHATAPLKTGAWHTSKKVIVHDALLPTPPQETSSPRNTETPYIGASCALYSKHPHLAFIFPFATAKSTTRAGLGWPLRPLRGT